MPDPQPGRYQSPHDTSVRRVYWHGRPPQLYAARTRPGQGEEPAYLLEPVFLTRLVGFGCWQLLDQPV